MEMGALNCITLLVNFIYAFLLFLQYRLVKEALHERANLLAIAPHLSAPLPIMLPVYRYL